MISRSNQYDSNIPIHFKTFGEVGCTMKKDLKAGNDTEFIAKRYLPSLYSIEDVKNLQSVNTDEESCNMYFMGKLVSLLQPIGLCCINSERLAWLIPLNEAADHGDTDNKRKPDFIICHMALYKKRNQDTSMFTDIINQSSAKGEHPIYGVKPARLLRMQECKPVKPQIRRRSG